MLVIPSEKLYSQVEKYFGKWHHNQQLYDMDILNLHFACRNQIMVLPKHYATLNSEYLVDSELSRKVAKCKEIKKVAYMHFSGLGKPWQHAENVQIYVQRYQMQIRRLIWLWIKIYAINTQQAQLANSIQTSNQLEAL